jgi:hypothetical protein
MSWIDNGYDLVWDTTPPSPRELRNSKFSLDNQEFATTAVIEMLEACAVSALPSGVLPTVISPLGVVPTPNSEKLRLIVNMKYANMHLSKRVFELEELSDLPDMAEKGDWSVAYDITSGYYHVSLHPDSRSFVGFNWKGVYYQYNCLPLVFSTAPWVF